MERCASLDLSTNQPPPPPPHFPLIPFAQSPKKRRRLQKKSASKASSSKATKASKPKSVAFSQEAMVSPGGATANQFKKFTLTVEKPTVTPAKGTPSAKSAPAASAPPTSDRPLMFVDGEVNPMGSHLHNHLPFLRKENLRDAAGVKYGEPDYNPRTLKWSEKDILKVSKSSSMTDAKRQWWEIKAQYFDTVLLFKTGKFYEMFHMDSDVAVRHLNFNHMKGAEGHAGCPEAAYGTISRKLLEAGFKVARVEQTETPAQLAERKRNTPKGRKKPGVVNREVCSVTSIGTRTYCFLDDDKVFSDTAKANANVPGPLLVVKEVILDNASAAETATDSDAPPAQCEYGVAIIDAVNSVVTLGQFADDSLR